MKVPIAQISLFLTALTAGTSAQGVPSLPPPEKDPFVGTWRANRAKSQPKLKNEEASYLRTIVREGDDLLFSSRIDSRIRAGKVNEDHYRIRCDGSPHPVPFGAVSCRYKAAGMVEGETLSLTKEKSYWAREVSSDGQEMKLLEYKNKTRTKLKAMWVLDRVN